MNLRDYFYLAVIFFLIIWGLVASLKPPRIVETISRDTILHKIPVFISSPGKIKYKTKTILREKTDTVFVLDTLRWTSCIDTTIRKANIKVCYEFPTNQFEIGIWFQPDTVRMINVIEKPLLKYEQQKNSWYVDALKIGGGVLLGYILGRSK